MTQPLNIFIVDDDREFARSLHLLFKVEGYETAFAFGGEEAIDRFRARDFDIVFVDMRMPGMNGIACLEGLRRIDPDAKMLLMTAYGTRDLMTDALSSGALGVLSKPLDVDDLLVALRAIEKGDVLVAGNDPHFVEAMTALLADNGYGVFVARDEEAAVEAVLRRDLDVLIVDLTIPESNGMQIMPRLKELKRTVPTVLASARMGETAYNEAVLPIRSLTDCLAQTYQPSEFLRTIEDLVGTPDKGCRQ